MDRRLYSRLKVKIEGLSYFNHDEYEIEITNISEEGIGFYMSKQNIEIMPRAGDLIHVAFADELGNICEENLDTHVCKVEVIQIRQEKDGVYIGCKIVKTENNYRKYVEKRKVGRFISGQRKWTGEINKWRLVDK